MVTEASRAFYQLQSIFALLSLFLQGLAILCSIDEIQILLDDQIVKSTTMRGSPYMGPFMEEFTVKQRWKRPGLCHCQELISSCISCRVRFCKFCSCATGAQTQIEVQNIVWRCCVPEKNLSKIAMVVEPFGYYCCRQRVSCTKVMEGFCEWIQIAAVCLTTIKVFWTDAAMDLCGSRRIQMKVIR